MYLLLCVELQFFILHWKFGVNFLNFAFQFITEMLRGNVFLWFCKY